MTISTKYNNILWDKSKFKPVNKDGNLDDLVKFQRFLYYLKRTNYLDTEVYARLDLLQQLPQQYMACRKYIIRIYPVARFSQLQEVTHMNAQVGLTKY